MLVDFEVTVRASLNVDPRTGATRDAIGKDVTRIVQHVLRARSVLRNVTVAKEYQSESSLIICILKAKNEAGRLGLFKTMHALTEVERSVGWEVAERREGDVLPSQRKT